MYKNIWYWLDHHICLYLFYNLAAATDDEYHELSFEISSNDSNPEDPNAGDQFDIELAAEHRVSWWKNAIRPLCSNFFCVLL